MNRTARAGRAAMQAWAIAALTWGSTAGCDSSPGQRAPAPVPAAPVPTSPSADASTPLAASKPAARVIPAGPVRLREASLGAAVLLVGALWDLPILALDVDPAPATLAIAGSEDVAAALAAAYQTSSASSKQLVVLAPEPRARAAAAAAESGRGRGVDLRFDAAPGVDLVRLLGDVERLTVAGELGGAFSLAVRRFPARRLLAVMAAACGATLSIRGKVAHIEGSQCSPAPPRPPPPSSAPSASSAFADRTLPGAPIGEIRVVGVGVDGARRLAVIAHAGAVAVVAPGILVGVRDAECERHWLASREETPERAAVIEALKRRDLLWLDRPRPADPDGVARQQAEVEAATRAVAEARAAEAAADERRKQARPVWCAADRGELVWKVEAIDAEGVTFAPVLDPGGRTTSFDPAPGVESRRLSIAE